MPVTNHLNAMIALIPSEEDLDRLVLEGEIPREELHLTLAFLGEAVNISTEAQEFIVNRIRLLIEELAERFNDYRIVVDAFAVSIFNMHVDEKDTAVVLGVDSTDGELSNIHRRIWSILDSIESQPNEFVIPPNHDPWTPHITLAYSDNISTIKNVKDKLGTVVLDKIRIVFADKIHDIELSALRDTTTSKGEDSMKSNSEFASECSDCEYDVNHFGSSNSISDDPWNGSASNFSDEQWKTSTAGCDSGENSIKERCFLPHHNPGGALNRSGLSKAAGRANQLSGRSPGAVAGAKAHLRQHYKAIGEEVPDNLKATTEDTQYLESQPYDDCPPGQHRMPDGECMLDEEMINATQNKTWTGILVVEGEPTGDGREFSPGSITWAELPIPLRWNIEDSHGGTPQTKAVNVGKIVEIWRDDNEIWARGEFDMSDPNGIAVYRKVKDKYLKGVSIDADDITEPDVEMVFPDNNNSDSILAPEKTIFHAGRIRAATLCDIPAFVQAYISIDEENNESKTSDDFKHDDQVIDEPWDFNINNERVPTDFTTNQYRSAFAYVYKESNNDKTIAHALHHIVNDDGTVGPANLIACASGIGMLNSGKMPELSLNQCRMAYNHLAKHLRDAKKEVPPLEITDNVVTASATIAAVDERPSREWFNNPNLSVPTPITITDAGRVYGHAAEWGTCHVGVRDVCVTPPEEDFHPYFMTGEVICADGSRVTVGSIVVGTSHASLQYGASRATEHYDNTGAAVADVTVGNDDHGIWVAGAIRPDAKTSKVRQLRGAGQVSGDWRRIGGQLRLVALLAVNVPGFPVPKLQARVASGAPQALVAAGRISTSRPVESEDELSQRALRALANSIAKRMKR